MKVIEKDPGAGKDWRQQEKGAAENEWLDSITDSVDMNLNTLQSKWQGSLACCSLWDDSQTGLSCVQQQQHNDSQGYFKGLLWNTNFTKFLKLLAKYQEMHVDSSYSILLFLVFSVLCSINISHVFILTQPDGKTTQINCAILAISVSKMQAVVSVEWKNYKLLESLAAESLQKVTRH